MTTNTTFTALRALPEFLAKRSITHRDGLAFNEAWVDGLIRYFEAESAATSTNYAVTLHFADCEPVNGLLEVRRNGTWAVSTAH